jgi:hypothetical protein
LECAPRAGQFHAAVDHLPGVVIPRIALGSGKLARPSAHTRHVLSSIGVGVTWTTVARSLIHSSSVIGLSEMMYLPIACSMF